ncbi:PRC-barrel domain-containing protein [Burkholderia gladioli]|uniref:PRC-barrel domain-containing protein n=1 Tax=Burkholderia gladioli TaxID=28095 RepID=UPI00163EA95F|nr:PRC-barrel domain-containing protein [Burkholderia gladioli]
MKTDTPASTDTPKEASSGPPSGPLVRFHGQAPSGEHPIPGHRFEGVGVRATDGADVGHVSDVLLDLGHGRITHVLVTTAEGHPDRVIAIPWQALSADTEGQGLAVAATAERVLAAPPFDKQGGCAAQHEEWVAAVDRHFGKPA